MWRELGRDIQLLTEERWGAQAGQECSSQEEVKAGRVCAECLKFIQRPPEACCCLEEGPGASGIWTENALGAPGVGL